MADFDLNLSTRPFPAYRLLNLALASLLVVLALASVWQVYGFLEYSTMARAIRGDEDAVRVEAEALRGQAAELEGRLDRPEAAAKLNEIEYLNGLIARKKLSWTRLFASLEDMVPDTVHLVSLAPTVGADGSVVLNIAVRGRSIADVSEFLEALEQSPVFENVVVDVETKQDAGASTDVNVTLTANYYSQRETR